MMDKVRKFRVGDELEQVTDRDMGYTVVYRVLKEQTAGGKIYVQIIRQTGQQFTTNPHHISADYLRRATELISEGPEPAPNTRVTYVRGDNIRIGETIRNESHFSHLSGDFVVEGIDYIGDTVQILTHDKPDGVLLTVPQPVRLSYMKYSMVPVVGKRSKKHPPLVHWNAYHGKEADIQVRSREGHWSMHCGARPVIRVSARNANFVTCPRCKADALQYRHTAFGKDSGV
jgi:hypothetical protein